MFYSNPQENYSLPVIYSCSRPKRVVRSGVLCVAVCLLLATKAARVLSRGKPSSGGGYA